jgi:hypothetical protein
MRRLLTLFLVSLFYIPAFAQESPTCPGSLPSRLTIGQTARVTPGSSNNVRVQPATDAEKVGEIPGGSVFTVAKPIPLYRHSAPTEQKLHGKLRVTLPGVLILVNFIFTTLPR